MSLAQYLPVLLFILVGLLVGVAPQLIGALLGPHKPDAAKNSPYECGFEAFEDARMTRGFCELGSLRVYIVNMSVLDDPLCGAV